MRLLFRGRHVGRLLSFASYTVVIWTLPSTPGYVGIYQFVAVSVLTTFGVTKDGVLALILLMQALGYVVVVAFGVPSLYRFRGWRQAIK